MDQPPINNYLSLAMNFERDAQGRVPNEIQLLPAGKIITGRDGRTWNNPNPQGIIDRFNTNQAKLPIDIEHSTEIKAPNGDPAPAVGWITKLYLRGDDSILGIVEWNEHGRLMLQNLQYRYLSPVFTFDPKTNNIFRLTSAALTNNPNLFLPALNIASLSNHSNGDPTMSQKITQALDLNDGASEANIVAAINALQVEKKAALNTAKNPDIAFFIPKADHELAVNQAKSAVDELAQIKAKQHQSEVDIAINTALEAGKIAPASVDYHTSNCATEAGFKAFKDYVATAAIIAPENQINHQTPNQVESALNATDKEAARLLGIDEGDFLEAKTAQAKTTTPAQKNNIKKEKKQCQSSS